jgi:hypothetical protein
MDNIPAGYNEEGNVWGTPEMVDDPILDVYTEDDVFGYMGDECKDDLVVEEVTEDNLEGLQMAYNFN